MFTFAWLSGFIWKIPTTVPTSGVVNGKCLIVHTWPSLSVQRGVGVLGIVVQYFLPLGLLIFFYARILMVLKQRGAGNNQVKSQGQQNVIKTLSLVAVAFIVCWTPNQLLFLQFNLGGSINFRGWLYYTTVVLVFVNACINPLVCILNYKECRNRIIGAFRRNQVSTSSEVSPQTWMQFAEPYELNGYQATFHFVIHIPNICLLTITPEHSSPCAFYPTHTSHLLAIHLPLPLPPPPLGNLSPNNLT